MISRADFMCTIGYEGNAAVVDASLKRACGALSTIELAEKGLFKQAVCSAIYEGGEPLAKVLEIYNSRTAHPLAGVEELKRIFGVSEVPEGIARVIVI